MAQKLTAQSKFYLPLGFCYSEDLSLLEPLELNR
jgi:hypothetical protein